MSLIYLAYQRESTNTAKFIEKEGNAALLVQNNCGKMPAHNAHLVLLPDFDLTEFLIKGELDLLFINNIAGKTLLDCIKKEFWSKQVKFLSSIK